MASVLTACAVGAGALASAANAGPPPGRAYELVSPIDDPSASVAGLTSALLPVPGKASDDGDRLIYGALFGLGSPWSGQTNAMVFGSRTAEGWRARTATVSIDHGDTPLDIGGTEAESGWPTADGRSYLFNSRNLGAIPTGPGKLLPGVFRATDDGAAPAWLTRPADGIVPVELSGMLGGVKLASFANRDRSVLAVMSDMPLTLDAPASPSNAVYAFRRGRLELVSRMPDGSLPTDYSQLTCVTEELARAMASCSGLAGDGRFVMFEVGTVGASAGAGGLFVRDLEQQVTRQIAGPAVGLGNAELRAASRDGDRAYFIRSVVPGTYEVDLATGVSTLRPAISGSIVGLGSNGRRMLFLDPNGTLRYWDGDADAETSIVVGTVGPDGASATAADANSRIRVERSLDGGRTWWFSAVGSLDPLRPSVRSATLQLYRWSVGGGAPVCISCSPVDGVARTSGVNASVQTTVGTESLVDPATTSGLTGPFSFGVKKMAEPGRVISDDERWLLFDSPDRLVQDDRNDVRDVYLWDRDSGPNGQLQLVTSGQGNTPSYALDIDATGKNAFFSTREGLVPADDNGNYNVYVARVGGGFPGSSESCVGEACRPAVIPEAPLGPVGSGQVSAPSEGVRQPVQAGAPKLRVRSVRSSVSRVTVRVDAPKAGRIRVSGSRVKTTSRAAKRRATYTLTVPLSASAKRSVARGKTVKVSLKVSFTPSGSKKASSVRSSVSVRKGR